MDLKKIRKNAENVLTEFDYKSVHDYMVENNHTWATGQIPDIEWIKLKANVLMSQSLKAVQEKQQAQHNGTGGLNVYIFPEWNGVKLTYEPRKFQKRSY